MEPISNHSQPSAHPSPSLPTDHATSPGDRKQKINTLDDSSYCMGASSNGAEPSILSLESDAFPSHGGAGTAETLEITKLLENAEICCCVVGLCALRYFGAWRLRHDWEICVPTHLVERASQIFQSEPHNRIYEMNFIGSPQRQPLYHFSPRFKITGVDFYFTIISAELAHLQCAPSKIERSQMGIPYPKLAVFAQSLLETSEETSLADLVDGMNLTEEWGRENLDLEGTHDIEWLRMKYRILAKVYPESYPFSNDDRPSVPFLNVRKEDLWKYAVNTKLQRLGPECPTEVYATRFYPCKDGVDPRSRDRDYV